MVRKMDYLLCIMKMGLGAFEENILMEKVKGYGSIIMKKVKKLEKKIVTLRNVNNP